MATIWRARQECVPVCFPRSFGKHGVCAGWRKSNGKHLHLVLNFIEHGRRQPCTVRTLNVQASLMSLIVNSFVEKREVAVATIIPEICVCPCGLKEFAAVLRDGRGLCVGTATLMVLWRRRSSSLRRSENNPGFGGSSSFCLCPKTASRPKMLLYCNSSWRFLKTCQHSMPTKYTSHLKDGRKLQGCKIIQRLHFPQVRSDCLVRRSSCP